MATQLTKRKDTIMVDYKFTSSLDGELNVKCEQALLDDIEDGGLMNGIKSVRFIIIHCTATRENQDYTAEQLMRDHKKRKFRTIGYHFYIRRSGQVSQHRRLLEVGAHCIPYNRCSIGVCYEGGLDSHGRPADTRTPQQRKALWELLSKLHRLFPKAKIAGHRDMPGATPKDCPCFDCSEYKFDDED